MRKHLGWSTLFTACWVLLGALLVTGTAQADAVRVTGAFTTFTGVVLGGNSSNGSFLSVCHADACAVIGPPFPPPPLICPDAGCSSGPGIVTNFPLGGNPAGDTVDRLSFDVTGQVSNALDFRANRGPGGSPLDVDPGSRFKLGTLTFRNGLWTGDADIGFSIVARDTTIGQSFTFTGFLHMHLTPNTGTPMQNADFITLRDAAGSPVISPLTLSNLGSIRAYELADSPIGSNSVTVDLFGQFGSLDPTDFANPIGGGFLDTSITAALGGPPPDPTAVPEPGTLLLLVTGLLAMAGTSRRTA